MNDTIKFCMTGLLLAVASAVLVFEARDAFDKSYENETNRIERHIELTESMSVKGGDYE